MITTIEFQYKDKDSARPYDESVLEHQLAFEGDEVPPAYLPVKGDLVHLEDTTYKVRTRYFSYSKSANDTILVVNIVVEDASEEEILAALKQ